jgi:iron(III) transport system substrate-binding protein
MCGALAVGAVAACAPAPLPSASSTSVTPALPTAGASKLDQLYADAKAEGQFTWGHALQADQVKPIKDAFEHQFPGITMTPVSVDGTTQAARLIEEIQNKRVSLDISAGGPPQIGLLMARDLLVTPDMSASNVAPQDLGFDKRVLWFEDIAICWIYNTNQVAPGEAPTTWDDLADPRWKGKIALQKAGSGFEMVYGMWDDDRVLQFVARIAQQDPVPMSSLPEAEARVARGESLLTSDNMVTAASAAAAGAPIAALPLGLYASPGGLFITSGAPHPKSALLFMNWMTTTEGKGSLQQANLGRFQECGPLTFEAFACGKNLQSKMYYVDDDVSSQHVVQMRPPIAKTLGFTQ